MLYVSLMCCLLCCLSAFLCFYSYGAPRDLHSFPTRRSSDLGAFFDATVELGLSHPTAHGVLPVPPWQLEFALGYQFELQLPRSEEHTSELQSLTNLVCRLLLEKKKQPVLNDSLCLNYRLDYI